MVEKQEVHDALEVYRRNLAHILGDKDEQVKVIETCQMLADEVEDHNGEWDRVQIMEEPIERWVSARCSECGLWVTTPYKYTESCMYDYCPNCGAKMKTK